VSKQVYMALENWWHIENTDLFLRIILLNLKLMFVQAT
jgi:hypothetical protein